MFKIVKALAVCATLAVLTGCGKTIDVIHNDNVVTNTVSFRSFQDESYVWETWSYGTNRADKAEIK